MDFIKVSILLTTVLHCNGIRILDHDGRISRRMYVPNEKSVILGAPSYPYHLPQAEPIMPGHTLLRPSLGMLKSAVKFPHKELEDGSGVYGHYENIGIKYDGKNERVLYTGFRRKGMSPDMEYYRPKKPVFNANTKSIKRYKNILKRIRKSSKYGKIVTKKDDRPLPSFNEDKWREIKNKAYWYEDNKNKRKMMQDPYNKIYNIYEHKPDRRYYGANSIENENSEKGHNHTSVEIQVQEDLAEILQILKSLQKSQELSLTSLKQNMNVKPEIESDIESDEEDSPDIDIVVDNNKKEKTKAFWETKDAFNHIRINPSAPELKDLLPELPKKDEDSSWWYFQQSDFKEFEKRKV